MNKKGQIYLFAAIIASVVLFALTIAYNKFGQRELSENFKDLSENYDLESARFINALVESSGPDEDNIKKLYGFSTEFSSYAKAKDPEYELLYIYSNIDGTRLYFGNLMNKKISVKSPPDPNAKEITIYDSGNPPARSDKLDGCYDKLNANIELGGFSVASTGINYGEIKNCLGYISMISGQSIEVCIEQSQSSRVCYEFALVRNKAQVMLVTGESEFEQRQVYIGGTGFLKGKKEG